MKSFFTLSQPGEAKLLEQKSLFIGNAFPVNDEKEALNRIGSIKSKYPDANHHVFAYAISHDTLVQKLSDGGEPAGTAGRPILEVLKREQLENVLVVVTRYFGGILLGAGGLTRTYAKSANLALNAGEIMMMVPGQAVSVSLDYTFLGKVQNFLEAERYIIDNIEYTDRVKILCHVEQERLEQIKRDLLQICHGACRIINGEILFIGKSRE